MQRPAISPAVLDSALRGDDVAPSSEVRRTKIESPLGVAMRQLRIDASLKATLYVPEAQYMKMITKQVIQEL